MQHIVSEKFRSVPAADRKCRFSTEDVSNSSMFRKYRQVGCLFECRLRNAIQSASCIPWNYPIPHGINESDFETCSNMVENGTSNLVQFHTSMDETISTRGCDCMPDCEEVTFKPQVLTASVNHRFYHCRDSKVGRIHWFSKNFNSDPVKEDLPDWKVQGSSPGECLMTSNGLLFSPHF